MPLDVVEMRELPRDVLGRVVQSSGRLLGSQQVAVGGTSTQGPPFSAGCLLIRVHADAPCRYAIGANPVASPASPRIAAGQTEFFGVRPGHRIAVIATT